MKKSLSLLLAIAMVFSMFAAVASAADELTTQQKFDVLMEAGIFEGYPPNNDPGLNREMTRAEFSKILALVTEAPSNASAATYTDVPASHWAAGFIGAVTEAGLMNGVGLNKFDPNGKVTVEQVAATLVRALGLEEASGNLTGTYSAWAQGFIVAAQQAGLPIAGPNYKANALRSVLVENAYAIVTYSNLTVTNAVAIDDKNIEVTFSDGETVKFELETPLVANVATTVTVKYQDIEFEVSVTLGALAISGATQTDAREITVNFNRALTEAETKDLTYTAKLGTVDYTFTAKWAEDKRSVALTANYLQAGEYDVTIKGFDAVKVTVAAAVATEIVIDTPAVQKAGNQDLQVKVLNQFKKAMPNLVPNITAFNASQGIALSVVNGKLDLSDLPAGSTATPNANQKTKVDDNVVITASYAQAGLNTSKTFKVVAGSAATVIKLGTIQPLKDKTRISINESGLVLPIELTDQYGNAVKLGQKATTTIPATDNVFVYDGLVFTLSDVGVISSYAVDANGVFTFSTGSKAVNSLVINIVNPATGAAANTTLRVDGKAVVKTIQLDAPKVEVLAANEEATVPFIATDSYDAPVAAKDITLGTVGDTSGKLVITSAGVPFAAGYPKMVNGELKVKFDGKGTAYIYAYVNGVQAGSTQWTVLEAATPVRLTGVTGVPAQIVNGVDVDFNKDNVTYVDSYNRTKKLGALLASEVVSSNTAVVTVVSDANGVAKLDAVGVGSAVITVTKASGFPTANNENVTTFNVTVVAPTAVTSYTMENIGTLYGKNTNDFDTNNSHVKTVKLQGTLNGQPVAINQNLFNFVTSEDKSIVDTDGGKKIVGKKAGTTVIRAIGPDGSIVATQTVTVSEELPKAAKVEFDQASYTVYTTAPNNVLNFTINTDTSPRVTVTDQYGVKIAAGGFLTSSNSAIATVDPATRIVTGVTVGYVTLTYTADSGVTATATLSVEAH